jgi:hypothetical protein
MAGGSMLYAVLRYQNYGCDLFLANYYHFAYLVHEDFAMAKRIMLS